MNMSLAHWCIGAMALGLCVYLFYALIRPERF